MSFGLTVDGFVQKRFEDIKAEVITAMKNEFGQDIDTSDQSVFGQLINLHSTDLADMWELANTIYSTRDPNSAEGLALDKIVQFLGIQRLVATSTAVEVILTGDDGTLVPFEHLIAKAGSLEEFELTADTTINKSNAVQVDLEITSVVDSTDYTISINSNPFTYNSGVGATAISIMAGLKAAVDAGSEPIDFTDNLDGTGYIRSDDATTPFTYTNSTGNVDLVSVGTPAPYEAVIAGATQANEDEITVIIEPITGLDSVNNLTAGSTGRDLETDTELRQRRRTAQAQASGGTEAAIINALIEDVDGVTDALIRSNREDTTDGDGRPPHSFETVVVGGDDDDVASKILEKAPAGIQFYGTETVPVTDSQGVSVDVKFSRSTPKYLHINIEYTLYSEEVFPTNGEALIKEKIIEFAEEEYTIGQDVIIQRLYKPIYEVPGIDSIDVLQIAVTANPGDSPSYGTSNISIAFAEQAIAATDRITVSET